MKKNILAVFFVSALAMAVCLAACSGGEKAPASASSGTSAEAVSESSSGASAKAASDAASTKAQGNGAAYGYTGDDPVEAAVYKYMAEEVSKQFDKADASIPVVSIVNVDYSNPDEVLVSGDFFVYNYDINGDTLECVSGGNFPGVMHVVKDGNGYTVSTFDVVEDGSNFDASAKELFGDSYEEFMKVYSNDKALDELRTTTVSDYVKLNGLDVTQYKDYGWDPVKLHN